MELGLKGKYALITGGSHGIGRSIAIELAKEGVNIAICSRTQSKLDETISILKQYNVVSISVNVDVLEADAVDKVMNVINKRWGKLDILVNNVGGGGRWGKEEPLDTKPEVWGEVYQKNAGVAAQFTMKSLPFRFCKEIVTTCKMAFRKIWTSFLLMYKIAENGRTSPLPS